MAWVLESKKEFFVFEDHRDQFQVPRSFRNIQLSNGSLSLVTYVIAMDEYSLIFEGNEIAFHVYACALLLTPD